ncbi:DUF4397 domain-containing protein [Pedobacter sp. LMG 31464]|uniref:DUF4397 domain-containing protein n=1 Tax=Pedobacter planticolens TaxID=2679964 RepID=A0A923DXU1_9SPHI|nr:DUF4397 domain-containing protein [Pedobacter planticolens]MBB2146031.1 DUF4397 domain-containing protein [Pedobacter planticolens]
MKKILYFIAVCTVLLAACKKNEGTVENTEYEKVAPGDPKYSYLKFLNLTPGSPVANFYVDGLKFSSALSSTGVENAGYAYNGLYPDLGYAITAPGSHKVTANIIPSATVDKNLEVLNATITPEAGKYYTIFTTGQYSSTNKSIGPLLVLEDVKPALDTSKIFIRMVNLYNGSPNLDLVKTATSTKVASNVAYGTASAFAEIPSPGPGAAPSNVFALNNTATGLPLLSNITIGLTKGRAYTFYLRGVLGSTTYPLSGTVYTTFY